MVLSIYNFSTLFQTLFAFYGSSTVTLRTGFLFLLATQLGFRYDYVYPDNYLTSTKTSWRPKTLTIVPDNACQRSKYNSPLTFDFVIVGAGAAGSTIASRLSENSNFSVLLIEAGSDPLVESSVPEFFPYGINNSRIWDHTADVVNSSANAFKNGCPMQCGKQLGGSTGTNAMMYVCGTDRDYDSWAAFGNTGWDYNSIHPYIKKSENNLDSNLVQNGYHGIGGPLTVSTYTNPDSYSPIVKAAFNELGYKTLQDYNARQYNGYVEVQATVKRGERSSAYQAFLGPVYRSRPNLTFMKSSHVTKILFTGSTATGVNVKTELADCPNIFIAAKKEVILSAGGQGSPKILLQSGVGRSQDLPVGVAQVKDLPVGENLQDHVYSIHFIKINPNSPSQDTLDVLLDSELYYYDRSGNFSELRIDVGGFMNTLDVNGIYPDIQIISYRFVKSQEDFSIIIANFGYKDEFIAPLAALNKDYEIIVWFTILLNPVARGTVKLRGSDPNLPPKITSNFLTQPDDVNTLLRGINKLQALVNTYAMKAKSAEIVKFQLAECSSLIYPSDAYWKCYIKYFTASLWHPSGTCKMGNPTDPGAVVDAKLKVYGISKLRVADASIMPLVTSGNTQCPTYAIGEKAADMIKAEWA